MQMRKTLGILLAVCFLMSVTAAAVGARESDDNWKVKEQRGGIDDHYKMKEQRGEIDDHCKMKEQRGHWEQHKELRHHHKDKNHPSDWNEIVIVNVFVMNSN